MARAHAAGAGPILLVGVHSVTSWGIMCSIYMISILMLLRANLNTALHLVLPLALLHIPILPGQMTP